tara:strand:+ start:5223 stop:5867 length:645 start_codon:yes stop_codon:yes gene_type:complete
MKKEFEKRILSSLILIPVSFFFIIKGSFFFNFFLIICFAVTLYEWHMMSKKKTYYPFGILFLILSFFTAYFFREDGLFSFLFIIIICISTDIGGYVSGKLFKGPKLTKISPNKTYSGLVGGYIFSIIFMNIFLNYSYLLNLKKIEFDISIFILVMLVSSSSQVGDIIISYFKRLSKIKDTGKIIPGHGGILDRIDGMIFAFPFSYLLLLIEIYT